MLILNKWLEELDIKLSEVAFIGDDLNDIPVMKEVAFSACPADAAKDVKKADELYEIAELSPAAFKVMFSIDKES